MPAISADVGKWSHAVFFSSIVVIRPAGHRQIESGIGRRLLAGSDSEGLMMDEVTGRSAENRRI